MKAAKSLWDSSPGDCVAALERLQIPSDPREAVGYWRNYVVHKEWHERIQRGLMPYHSHDISDMGFRFVDLEPWGKAAQESGSIMDIGLYLFCRGERVSCEKLLRLFERNGHVAATVRFQRDFHEGLGEDREFDELPPVDFQNEVTGVGPVVWLACDATYLAFALPMIRSLKAVAPEVPVHLHIFNPPVSFEKPLGVGISTEVCPRHKGYYHAVRFVRLYQFQRMRQVPAWLMDVDALFNNHPTPLFDTLDGYDVALRARPARLEPWNQLNACVVGFNTSGAEYLKKLANYVYALRHFLAWGIDQTAMLCVYEASKPKVACLGERFVDYDYRGNGVVWCNSSTKKWAHLQALSDPSVSVERPAYFERFKLFS